MLVFVLTIGGCVSPFAFGFPGCNPEGPMIVIESPQQPSTPSMLLKKGMSKQDVEKALEIIPPTRAVFAGMTPTLLYRSNLFPGRTIVVRYCIDGKIMRANDW